MSSIFEDVENKCLFDFLIKILEYEQLDEQNLDRNYYLIEDIYILITYYDCMKQGKNKYNQTQIINKIRENNKYISTKRTYESVKSRYRYYLQYITSNDLLNIVEFYKLLISLFQKQQQNHNLSLNSSILFKTKSMLFQNKTSKIFEIMYLDFNSIQNNNIKNQNKLLKYTFSNLTNKKDSIIDSIPNILNKLANNIVNNNDDEDVDDNNNNNQNQMQLNQQQQQQSQQIQQRNNQTNQNQQQQQIKIEYNSNEQMEESDQFKTIKKKQSINQNSIKSEQKSILSTKWKVVTPESSTEHKNKKYNQDDDVEDEEDDEPTYKNTKNKKYNDDKSDVEEEEVEFEDDIESEEDKDDKIDNMNDNKNVKVDNNKKESMKKSIISSDMNERKQNDNQTKPRFQKQLLKGQTKSMLFSKLDTIIPQELFQSNNNNTSDMEEVDINQDKIINQSRNSYSSVIQNSSIKNNSRDNGKNKNNKDNNDSKLIDEKETNLRNNNNNVSDNQSKNKMINQDIKLNQDNNKKDNHNDNDDKIINQQQINSNNKQNNNSNKIITNNSNNNNNNNQNNISLQNNNNNSMNQIKFNNNQNNIISTTYQKNKINISQINTNSNNININNNNESVYQSQSQEDENDDLLKLILKRNTYSEISEYFSLYNVNHNLYNHQKNIWNHMFYPHQLLDNNQYNNYYQQYNQYNNQQYNQFNMNNSDSNVNDNTNDKSDKSICLIEQIVKNENSCKGILNRIRNEIKDETKKEQEEQKKWDQIINYISKTYSLNITSVINLLDHISWAINILQQYLQPQDNNKSNNVNGQLTPEQIVFTSKEDNILQNQLLKNNNSGNQDNQTVLQGKNISQIERRMSFLKIINPDLQ